MANAILLFCAVVVLFGSLVAEFRENHVFNERWPAHARFHCVAYALTNAGIGAICVVLLVADATSGSRIALVTAIALLLLIDATTLGSSAVRGVSPVGDGERVTWGWPSSYWITSGHLGLVLLGAYVAW